MTIRHLQIFKTVCDCKSITAAAERLNITQPSVSMAVKELENFYDTILFDRINRRIYLTEEGTTLRQYADNLLALYDESVSVLRNKKHFMTCRIGVNVSVAETYLPRIVTAVRDNIPDIKLKIYIQNNEQIDQLLTDNGIDFAIYDKINDSKARTAKLLFQDTIVACCCADRYIHDSILPEQLSSLPLLLREQGSGMRAYIDAEFIKYGYPQNIAAESTSTLGLVELAEIGMGYALLPQKSAEKICAGHALKFMHIRGGFMLKKYYLTYNSNKFLNPTLLSVAKIFDMLQDTTP